MRDTWPCLAQHASPTVPLHMVAPNVSEDLLGVLCHASPTVQLLMVAPNVSEDLLGVLCHASPTVPLHIADEFSDSTTREWTEHTKEVLADIGCDQVTNPTSSAASATHRLSLMTSLSATHRPSVMPSPPTAKPLGAEP